MSSVVQFRSERRENGRFKAKLMDIVAVITGIAAFAAGIAADWIKGLGASVLSNREIRKAIQAEIHAVLIGLNFYILAAINEVGVKEDIGLTARYFGKPLQLESFRYYWEQKRDHLLRLPEWSRLKNWNDSLGQIGQGPHPPLFAAIMLFESLTISPLDKCVSRGSLKFVRNVLAGPGVSEYKMDYLLRASGLKT